MEMENGLWTQRNLPQIWDHAFTLPLPKPNKDPTSPEGFRPISITCNTSKTFERMAMNRLTTFLEAEGHFNPYQNGFRKNRSSIDNVVVLKEVIRQGIDAGDHAFCIFFDMQKAYDRIYRPLVLRQLLKLGIGGNMVHFVKNFLQRRTFQVRLDGYSSGIWTLENGLPQGSVAAVCLFLLAINDFERDLKLEFERRFPSTRIVLLSYADDKAAVVLGPQESKEPGKAAQFVLTFTDEWLRDHGLELSPTKTQILHFCGRRRCNKPTLRMRSLPLKISRTADFLGITLDTRFI